MSVAIRPASVNDQEAIVALVRTERLNPTGLHWPNFVVATHGHELVGAAQIRKHRDGSRELGSLVVKPQWRGQGVASGMIDALLASEPGDVLAITGLVRTAYFSRWGFRPIAKRRVPVPIRTNYYAGLIFGGLVSLLQRRTFNRLVILARTPAQVAPG